MSKKRNTPMLWTPVGSDGIQADAAIFRARQGHGFTAERANHFADVISGKATKLIGGDNAKDELM